MKEKLLRYSDVNLGCMLRHLIRNLWMMVAAALIMSMSVSLYFTWFHVPQYRANMTYAVTSRKTTYASGGNLSSARAVASVMSEMLQTGMVLNNVRASDPALENFQGTISTSLMGDSNFIVITVTDSSPEQAVMALHALQDLLPTVTGYLTSGNIVQLVRNPAVSAVPINNVDVSRYSKIAALGGAGAVAVAICFLVLRKQTIQTRSGARHLLDAPIIASLCREKGGATWKQQLKNRFSSKKKKPLHVFSPSISFAYSEQINAICAHLENEQSKGTKVFMITGASESEGKSTVSGNVAAALALRGHKVALLDCDMRNPSLHRFFDNKYTAPMPLNELLGQPFTKENLLQCMQPHEKLGLFMLFSRSPDRRCTELVTGPSMDALLRQLRVLDFVILDTPPMNYFADAEALAEKVDASILVVRQDRSPAAEINTVADVLRAAGSRFLGVILNDMTSSATEGYGYGKGYGYDRYGYGKYGSGSYGYGYGYGASKHSGKYSSRKGG